MANETREEQSKMHSSVKKKNAGKKKKIQNFKKHLFL